MRPKVFLAILVGLALMLSFGVTVKDAKADAILFPWIVKSSTVSTVVSVVNTAGPQITLISDPELLHYQYWHKIATPYPDVNNQLNICNEYDFKAYISKDDLVSFDTSGKINSGLPLWNDNDPLHPNDTIGFASDYRLNVAGDVRAFLIVDNNTPHYALESDTNTDGTLYGEALVLEITTGAAWGYIAYNASGGVTSYQEDPVYFEDGRDYLGEVIGTDETTQTIILNPNSVTTKFFVTPLTDDYDTALGIWGARSPNSNTRIQLCRTPDYDGDCLAGGMYDNVEGPISFGDPKNVVCTDAAGLIEIMGEAAFNSFASSGRSGWGYIITQIGTVDQAPANGIPDNPCLDMIVGKLEYTDTNLAIDGMLIPPAGVAGGINSFLWLRNSENGNTGQSAINYIHNERD